MSLMKSLFRNRTFENRSYFHSFSSIGKLYKLLLEDKRASEFKSEGLRKTRQEKLALDFTTLSAAHMTRLRIFAKLGLIIATLTSGIASWEIRRNYFETARQQVKIEFIKSVHSISNETSGAFCTASLPVENKITCIVLRSGANPVQEAVYVYSGRLIGHYVINQDSDWRNPPYFSHASYEQPAIFGDAFATDVPAEIVVPFSSVVFEPDFRNTVFFISGISLLVFGMASFAKWKKNHDLLIFRSMCKELLAKGGGCLDWPEARVQVQNLNSRLENYKL